MNANSIRCQSLDDDDNFSSHSRNSSGFFNILNSTNNSDSECSGPISVRDMIQRYNQQFQITQTQPANYKIKCRHTPNRKQHSHQQLAATKSSFSGLNTYGTQMHNNKQLNGQLNDEKATILLNDHEQQQITCCKNCTACLCCQTRSLTNSTTTKMLPPSVTTPLLWQENNENKQNSSSLLSFHSNGCGIGSDVTNNCCNQINANKILAVENYTINGDETVDMSKPNCVTNADETKELNHKDSIVDIHKNLYQLQHHNSQLFVEQKKNRLLSIDSIEEATQLQQHQQQQQHHQQQPTETCYQSKTTIAKTSSGVRIIIDIYFDQEQCTTTNGINNASDIVGSRVETDIPQSRILNEFQQQLLAKNKSNTVLAHTNTSVTTAAAGAVSSSATSFNRG